MKRLLKSWVFWAFVVPPLTASALFGIHRETSRSWCLCSSTRSSTRWLVGIEKLTWSPGGGQETTRISAIHNELLTGFHQHTWKPSGRTRHSVLVDRSSCGGFGPFADAAMLYEHEAAFRTWLKAEVASGRISSEMIRAAVEAPAPDGFAFGWKP